MLRGPRHPPLRKEAAGVLPTALAATGAGLVTGVAGVGGGFIVVPALVFVTGMPMQRAVGTALLVIVFNAVGGLASYSAYVSIDRTIWAPFAAAAMISAMAGTFLGRRLGEKRLRTVFAVGLLVLGLFTIVKEGFMA
jgi:uncharacterized membrane protein YfcA